MTFLLAPAVSRWLACPGSAALEETESQTHNGMGEPISVPDQIRTSLEALGAKVSVATLVYVDIGQITGERGANACIKALLIGEFGDHSVLHVFGHDETETKLLTLAALLKYGLLHNFTETGSGTVDELYIFGAQVTEAAQLALSLRADVAALSHLTSGSHCTGCLAAYRCPALAKNVHEEVFGELQALDEPNLTPVPVSVRAPDNIKDYIAGLLPRLPLILSWVASVRSVAEDLSLLPPHQKAARVIKRRKKRKTNKPKKSAATTGSTAE